MDPNKAGNDISVGSKNVSFIFECFAYAYSDILKAMKRSDRPSLLDWMLGGDYGTFSWQRNHLRKVYRDQFGGPGLELA